MQAAAAAGGRWSSEALQAMDTHLGLLKMASDCGCERTGRALRLSGPSYEASTGPYLDLSSNTPLPHGWEQFLDLQTGQVYYIDWKRRRRSYTDPRTATAEEADKLEDADSSECLSDADNECASAARGDGGNNRLISAPMLQEDWELMETRGWVGALDCDDRSEITTVRTPAVSASSGSFFCAPHHHL